MPRDVADAGRFHQMRSITFRAARRYDDDAFDLYAVPRPGLHELWRGPVERRLRSSLARARTRSTSHREFYGSGRRCKEHITPGDRSEYARHQAATSYAAA
jgi:hypothetical protein